MRSAKNSQNADLLSGAEWLALTQCILAINRASTHDDVRYQALKSLLGIVPFQSAAFFLADPSRRELGGCLIVQPAGTDISSKEFEACVHEARRLHENAEGNPSSASCVVFGGEGFEGERKEYSRKFRYLAASFLLVCLLTDESGLVGAVVLSRTGDQGEFSDRDRFVLETLEPHLALRLEYVCRTGEYGVLRADSLHEQYRLTKRELDVMCCVAYGMTVPEIATKLTISSGTARKHLENIYRKVGVNNRMSLMKLAQQYLHSSAV